jgi:hypothetical protein
MSTDAQLAFKICQYTNLMENSSYGIRKFLHIVLIKTILEKRREDFNPTPFFSEREETVPEFGERLLRYIGDPHLRVLLDDAL